MIRHSYVYALFSAFLNSWNKSFTRRALFVDFGLERKYEDGFFGRTLNNFTNIIEKINAWFARIMKESRIFAFYRRKTGEITSSVTLAGYYNASFFAKLAGKVFSLGVTELSVFVLAFLIPIVPTKIVLALGAVVAVLFSISVFVTGKTKLKFQLMDLFVLLFLIMLTYSVLISYNMKSSAQVAAVYILFIALYFAVKNVVNTKEKLYTVVSLIVLAGFLVSLYGVYQWLTGSYIETESWIDSDMFETATRRIYSTLDNPNVLGEYLLFIIPLAFGMLYYLKNNFYKLAAPGILGVTVLCMVFTQSRGAWLGLILTLALFALLNDRRLVLLGLAGLMFSPVIMPRSIIERFTSIGNMSDSSTSYRVNIWLAALLMIQRFWPSGIGLGTDTFVYIYRLFAFNAGYAFHSHNLYLQLVIDMGIFGLIVFIAYMCCFFKNLLVTVSTSKDKFLKAVSAALCAGMAGYLLQGFTDNVWYNYRIVAMFWLLMALSGAAANISKAKMTAQPSNVFSKNVGLPLNQGTITGG